MDAIALISVFSPSLWNVMPETPVAESKMQSIRDLAWWLYIFHGFSLVFSIGAFSWIPLIISYLKRPDAVGTFVYSHHSWQIRSFWWYLFWMIVGGIAFATLIGIPLAFAIWGLAWVWKAYRLIRGFLELNDNKPMPV